MGTEHTVIRDAYVYDRDAVVDLSLRDGRIDQIAPSIDERGDREIDADGNLVAPGFVDSHLHMDKAYTAAGERFPKYNETGTDFSAATSLGAEYQNTVSPETLRDNAIRLGLQAAANGTLHIRAHVNVGSDIGGTSVIEQMLSAREALRDIVEIQFAPMVTTGVLNDPDGEELLHRSLELGADVVGGADPATRNLDTGATLDTWFDIATEHDAEIDPHIQHPSTLGVHVLHRLAEKTEQCHYGGKVTASHSYCLAEMSGLERHLDRPGLTPAELKGLPDGQLDKAVDRFADAGMKFVTCHPSTRPGMPLFEFDQADVPVGWGSDNISDWIIRHAQPDALQGALVNAFKLDYNLYSFASNPALDLLWRMSTENGAAVLGIEDRYGLEEGNPADIVVFDEPSPHWAIIRQATRRYVFKAGQLVAEDGEIVPELRRQLLQ